MCGLDVETACHILWRCPSSNDVRGNCTRKIQKIPSEGDYFMHILYVILENLDK
jgi:hypothetical protein